MGMLQILGLICLRQIEHGKHRGHGSSLPSFRRLADLATFFLMIAPSITVVASIDGAGHLD
jgi:hypothetical protein